MFSPAAPSSLNELHKPPNQQSLTPLNNSNCSTANSSMCASSTSSLLSGGAFGGCQIFSVPVDRSCCSPSPQVKHNKLYESEFFGGNVANFTFEYLTDNDTDDEVNSVQVQSSEVKSNPQPQKLNLCDQIDFSLAFSKLEKYLVSHSAEMMAEEIAQRTCRKIKIANQLNYDQVFKNIQLAEQGFRSFEKKQQKSYFSDKKEILNSFEPRAKAMFKKRTKPRRMENTFVNNLEW